MNVFMASEEVDIFGSENKKITQEQVKIQKTFAKWIHSIGFLSIYFDDGNLKSGFGILLEGGYFLTSSEILRSYGKYPKKIEVKMQDDSANPLICIANLQIQRLDNALGLALLKTQGYTNDYCQPTKESFYHKRIYSLQYLGIKEGELLKGDEVYYPEISSSYSFEVLKNQIATKIVLNQTEGAIYDIDDSKMQKVFLGRPFFDKNGDFKGMM
ncbi:hypothetical protein, partial [Helicobacter anatolicus]|uniref:hypothetical protein n=1 Tax=Helicobacter anatolicus TaxID=2905874 RepID=UPI001E474C54